MKATITQAERLQLIGLLALAEHHNRALVDITKATSALLGAGPVDDRGNIDDSDDRRGGHITDSVYGDRGHDELLRLLDIAIEADGERKDA